MKSARSARRRAKPRSRRRPRQGESERRWPALRVRITSASSSLSERRCARANGSHRSSATFLGEIWHKPIDRIEAPELLDAVVKVTSQYPETGRRVRQRLELVFADAEFRKLCDGNPGRAIREKVREDCGGRRTESYRTLYYRDVPPLLPGCRPYRGRAHARWRSRC